MPVIVRWMLAVITLLAWGATTGAQESLTPLAPVRPLSRGELERREALKLYALGLKSERENRLLEAVRYFESAAKLDAGAAPLYKALLPLYLALERGEDAQLACRKTLELDPDDYETWYLRARLDRDQGKATDAATSLARALASPRLKDQPDLVIQIAGELGGLREQLKEYTGALAAFDAVARVLDNPAPLVELGPFTRKEIDAKAAEVHERIGMLCLQLGQYERAVTAFATAQKKDPEMAGRLNLHLAKVRFAQDKPRDALRYLDAFLRTQPQGLEAYELKITVLQKLDRADDVLPELRQHAANDPHNLSLQLLLARQYARERDWTEAEKRYKNLARESPTTEIYAGLFNLYKAQGPARVAEVLDLLDSTLKEATRKGPDQPGDAAAAVRARAMLAVLRDDAELVKALLPLAIGELNGRRERSGETMYFLAILAARNRQLPAAEKLYRDCLNHTTPQTEHDIYGGLLQILWETRQYEEVVKLCRKGLKETQQVHRLLLHRNLAQAHAQLGKFDDALAEADQSVNVAEEKYRLQARLLRARILAMSERTDRAVADCQEMLREASPGETRDIRYTLSGIYSAARQHAKAEEQLRLILEADPNDDSANNDLGYIMADQGKNLEEAEQRIRKAIELDRAQKRGKAEEASAKKDINVDSDKDHASYVDSLGWVLFRRGQIEEACRELEKAVTLPDGDDPVIWDHLGDVYLRLQQADKARAAWRKSVKLYETDRRRKQDEQYRELKQKLKLVGP